jgi:hypothetical protein
LTSDGGGIISAAEWFTGFSEWINNRAHGQQLKARSLKTSARRAAERRLNQPLLSRIANTTIVGNCSFIGVGTIL